MRYILITNHRCVISRNKKSLRAILIACKAEMQSVKDFFATLKRVVLPRTSVEMTSFFSYLQRPRSYHSQWRLGYLLLLFTIHPYTHSIPVRM